MYDTSGGHSVCDGAPAYYDILGRLNWLKGELEREERRQRLARNGDEEGASLLMRNPVTAAEAYRWFGMFLGLFPPAAIFARIFGHILAAGNEPALLALCLAMLAVCCIFGRKAGEMLGRKLGNPRARSKSRLLLISLLFALVWGVMTGGLGGLVFFGIGAFVGAFLAVPVAIASFPLFMQLHRLLSRDGMIEERHMLPLAFGLPCVIAAAILGL